MISNKNIGKTLRHRDIDFFIAFVKKSLIPEGLFMGLSKAAVERRSLRYMFGLYFMFRVFQKTCLKYTSS